MSDANMSDGTFNRLFIIMIIAMIALTAILMVVAVEVSVDVTERLDAQSEAENSNNIAQRIAPVGQMAAAGVISAVVPEANAQELSGEEVYTSSCAACHDAGIAGAPKTGDAAAWSARIAQGNDTLYSHAIQGYQGSAGFMPAKGGNAALSDDNVKAAVDYMVSK